MAYFPSGKHAARCPADGFVERRLATSVKSKETGTAKTSGSTSLNGVPAPSDGTPKKASHSPSGLETFSKMKKRMTTLTARPLRKPACAQAEEQRGAVGDDHRAVLEKARQVVSRQRRDLDSREYRQTNHA
ncbi:MAG: hypothetical protein WCB88_15070, partial [Azonexus sp.]